MRYKRTKFFVGAFFLLLLPFWSTGQVETIDTDSVNSFFKINADSVYKIVEVMPEYLGGDPALLKFISTNVQYPVVSKENGISGVVYVSYLVHIDGSIKNVEIAKSVDPFLDKEAIRVVKLLKGYKPGFQDGKPVPVQITIPIQFVLNNVGYDPNKVSSVLTYGSPSQLGKEALANGNYRDAVFYFSKCVDFDRYRFLSKTDAENAYMLGISYMGIAEQDSGLVALNRAIDIGGAWYYDAFLTRADLHFARVDFKKAKEDYHKSLQINRKLLDGLIGRGKSSFALGFYEDAREDFEKAIRFHPQSPEGYSSMGALNLGRKELPECILNFSEALALDPKDGNSHFQRGMCYARSRNMEAGCKDWVKAKELGVKDAELLVKTQCLGEQD